MLANLDPLLHTVHQPLVTVVSLDITRIHQHKAHVLHAQQERTILTLDPSPFPTVLNVPEVLIQVK